jgi:hypothetical protein
VLAKLLSLVRGINPQDETEALLATQMAAIHHATMVAAQRLQMVDNIPQQDSASNMLNKLARTFTAQVETLKNYRSSGEQHIRVQHQHVTVNDGGQAIVAGQIKQGGRGVSQKTDANLMNLVQLMNEAPRCSATSKRTGCRCRAPALRSKAVCRFHGGRAGAPKGTANGAWRHGGRSDEAIAMRRQFAELARKARATIARLGRR